MPRATRAMYNKDKIMRKLLGKAAVESSPSSSLATDHHASLGVTSSPFSPTTRPTGSQDASFDAGSPIDRLDSSPDGHSAILAGRHILKIVKLHGTSVHSGVDLRAAIQAQPVVKNSTVYNSVADQLSIKDVKWLKGRGDTTVFTACANGKIFQYDLTRLGGGADGAPMDVIHMREDSRQINCLDINPRSSYLLAGSQDGIVRCFDILNPVRTHTGHLTFRAFQAFKCNAGGIQSIQWSQHVDGAFYFACGTDQGVVLKWDIRKATAPVLRINAHDKACAALAWHPDGDHLVSAGWDHRCCVWDVSAKADKRQKPKYTITTPAPVADVAWRPGTWSATAHGKRAAQLAVTYDDTKRHGTTKCHIWDLARRTMPFKEVRDFESPPAALLWHDQDLLWTAGHDGLFNQFDIAYAPKVTDHITMSAFSWSSQGDILAFLDERPPTRRPHRTLVSAAMLPHSTPYSTSPTNNPMLSVSRSDSDDEVASSFLGAHRSGPKHRRPTVGSRSAQSLSTTPPGAPDAPALALDQSIKAAGLFRSHQAMVIGRIPSAAKVNIYEYLSSHYLEALNNVLPYKIDAASLEDRVATILNHYARAAETIGHFRLAQIWRLLAHAMHLLLPRRAQHHLDRRSGELERSDKAMRKSRSPAALQALDANINNNNNGKNTTPGQSGPVERNMSAGSGHGPLGSSDKPGALRSLLAEEFESTSNATTPLARPVDGGDQSSEQRYEPTGHRFEYGKKLTPVQEGASFILPPPVQGRQAPRKRLDSEPTSHISHESDTHASTEGYDFYDTETISRAIDVPSSKGHDSHDFATRTPSSVRRVVTREDSEESFGQMFSISSGGSRQASGLTASSSGSIQMRYRRTGSGSMQSHPQLARSVSTEEYESRIRGDRIRRTASAPDSQNDLPETQLTDDLPLPTQTTMDSIDSQRGEFHPKPEGLPRDTPSVGVSPYTSFEFRYDDLEQIQETDYLPWSDDPPYPYPIAWEDDDLRARPSPLDPLKVISWALEFETRTSALNASAMVMLLRPLIRDDRVFDPFQAAAIVKQHHSRLMGMKLSTQAALLRKMCVKGWPGEPLLDWGDDYSALFRTAQVNNKAAFVCPTCHKPRELDRRNPRKQPNPLWQCERCTAVMAPCAICKHRDTAETAAPIEISPEVLRCAAERQDEVLMSTWWHCPGCGHGGHASCLQEWHCEVVSEESNSSVDGIREGLYSDGCCPFDGCGHACLPGKYRAETAMARTEETSRAVREVTKAHASGTTSPRISVSRYSTGVLSSDDLAIIPRHHRRQGGHKSLENSVHGDLNEIAQSRAVDSVRETLASHAHGTGMAHRSGLRHAASAVHLGGFGGDGASRASGIATLGSSPVRTGHDRERRKSVKFGASTVLSDESGPKRP